MSWSDKMERNGEEQRKLENFILYIQGLRVSDNKSISYMYLIPWQLGNNMTTDKNNICGDIILCNLCSKLT